MNPPGTPTVERNKHMKILDMLSAEVVVPLVSKVVEWVDNIEWRSLGEEELLRLRFHDTLKCLVFHNLSRIR